MLKKILAVISSFILCVTALCACGESDSSGGQGGSSEVQESSSEPEKLPETDEEWDKAMCEKALVSYGNTSLIKEKIEKAKNGEDITIGYLGGSITYGYKVNPDQCYAYLTHSYFAEKFGSKDNVGYCNAGLSGTPSKLGILRMQRDLLESEPDIVFVEFAVNDGTDFSYQEAYESIIRTLLEKGIAPVLLFSVTKDDYSAQDYMKELGEYYDLPMISYCDALRFLFENNRLEWKDFSNDEAHPNPEGHKLVAKLIDNYFDTVEDIACDEYKMPDEPKNLLISYGAKMYESDALDADSLGSWQQGGTDVASFTNGWKRDGQEDNSPLEFTVTGKNVIVIYKEVAKNSGAAVVEYTDENGNTDSIMIDPNAAGGWGNPQTATLVTSDDTHTYKISVSMLGGDEDKPFQLLGLGVTE